MKKQGIECCYFKSWSVKETMREHLLYIGSILMLLGVATLGFFLSGCLSGWFSILIVVAVYIIAMLLNAYDLGILIKFDNIKLFVDTKQLSAYNLKTNEIMFYIPYADIEMIDVDTRESLGIETFRVKICTKNKKYKFGFYASRENLYPHGDVEIFIQEISLKNSQILIRV
jgi:hypothetical protein